MPPHHRSRPSRGESPHREPLSSTPSRSKYTFPVVNTPVLRRSRHNSENLPPDSALNFKATSPFSDANTSSPALSKSSSKSKHNSNASLPPRPPSSKPSPATSHRTTGNSNQETQGNAKRKLNLEATAVHTEPVVLANTCQSALQEQDSGVKVIIRIRPCNHKEELEEATQIVERNSCDSLSLGEQRFTFDHVVGTDASQQTMFEILGLPLVENCLQGFNSSIFAYGQTGSGKTYTMWGATQDLTAAQPPSEERGLTLRVFERLFQRIKEEEAKNTDKQLHYQCRCSFLEIYNEQITDLLEPQQKALQVREDIKTGVYVENLTEEYVSNYDEVFHIMLKGLGNRKVGSTSMNLESSRSHTLFTCVIESRCKSISDGVSSVRTSRMNLVDLAGSERQKLTGAAGERLKEAGNINRSLSQLGNLIHILAEMSQSGKPRHIPYRDSRLTFLLQESLGGNAKLAMICAISPASSCKSETLSTLRFAQRAKAIRNKAVVNEETENDVNLLREQIRQLKDELMKMKSHESQPGGIGSYSTTWNARRSYNLLRMSLSRPLTLPHTDSDTDEEMEIDEDAVESVDGLNPSTSEDESTQAEQVNSTVKHDEPPKYDGPDRTGLKSSSSQSLQAPTLSVSPRIQDDDMTGTPKPSEIMKPPVLSTSPEALDATREPIPNVSPRIQDDDIRGPGKNKLSPSVDKAPILSVSPRIQDDDMTGTFKPSQILKSPVLSISPHLALDAPQEPILSVSPRIQDDEMRGPGKNKLSPLVQDATIQTMPSEFVGELMTADSIRQSSLKDKTKRKAASVRSSLPSGKALTSPTDRLAESLHRGLQILENHQKKVVNSRTSVVRFSFQNLQLDKSKASVVDKSIQTSPMYSPEKSLMPVSKLQQLDATEQASLSSLQPSDTSSWAVVAADEPKTPPAASKVLNQCVQRVEAVLVGAIRRERAMEETLNRKNAEIEQLNRLVRQYKHERECNAVLQQSLEDKIARLESLMDGTMPTEVFLQEEWSFQLNEYKILQEKYDHHPEVTLANIKQQRLCDDLEQYRNFYDLGEREALLGEISELRNQLQSYIESEAPRSGKKTKSHTPQTKQDSLENKSIIEPLATSLALALTTEKERCGKCEELQQQWAHQENEWMAVLDEMRIEVEDYKQLVKKKQHELDGEHRCADEMKEALQMAMEGHARLLDQYAELQEKHISLLAKHRKIRDGMADARKRAGKLGFLGAKWFEAQAAELVALKLEHEHERKMAKEQIEGLQAQVRDTADAVQAAGELLVRLKEAEEAVLIAQDAAALAEQDADKLHREIEKLKRRHSTEIATLQQRLMEARLRKSTVCPMCAMAERVKFQFVEVDAEEHEAALEAEHLAAETAAAAASASSSMPFHNREEDGYLGMLREEGEGDDDQVQIHQGEHFPDVEEEFNLGHSRVLELDDRWYDDGQQCNY